MRTIAITRCSQELQRILKIAKRKDVVLRTPARDEVLLSLIDDFDYEIAAQRRNKKLMRFLRESYRRARKEKGIPLDEVARQLGLPARSDNHQRAPKRDESAKMICVSRRSELFLDLLHQASNEDVIFKTPDGSEYALTALRGDRKYAKQRLSETVMAYLDELGRQGKLPPLEVVFVEKFLPRIGQSGNRRAMRKHLSRGKEFKL